MRFATLKNGSVAAITSDDTMVLLDDVCASMADLAGSYET